MPTRKKVLHVRSNRALTNDVTKPQLPESSFLDYGELAINYGEGIETLSIKNSENDIITFSSDIYNSNTYTTKEETIENELVTSTALTEHEGRLDDLDETVAGKQDALTFDATPTANSTNPVTSGGIKTALDDKIELYVIQERAPHFLQEIYGATSESTGVVLSTQAKAEYEDLVDREKINSRIFAFSRTDIANNTFRAYRYDGGDLGNRAFDDTLFAYSRVGWPAGDPLEINGLIVCHHYDFDTQTYESLGNDIWWIESYTRNIQEELTFDTTPTANSTNPVTSGGLYTELSTYAKKADLTSLLTYKGTIGTGGTVSTLPADASVGDTYQAIAGCPNVNGKAVEAGDLVVNVGSNTWTVVQNNIVVDTQLDDTSLNPVENRVITTTIRNNERVIATALTRVNDNAGFDVNGEYSPTSTNYIGNATSISDAVDILDDTIGDIDDTLSTVSTTYATKSEVEDANPLVWVNYWTNLEPFRPSSGEYWYDTTNVVLKVTNGSSWTRVTLSQRKLYINLSSNEIYRYDGRDMVKMTINPTSLVTT